MYIFVTVIITLLLFSILDCSNFEKAPATNDTDSDSDEFDEKSNFVALGKYLLLHLSVNVCKCLSILTFSYSLLTINWNEVPNILVLLFCFSINLLAILKTEANNLSGGTLLLLHLCLFGTNFKVMLLIFSFILVLWNGDCTTIDGFYIFRLKLKMFFLSKQSIYKSKNIFTQNNLISKKLYIKHLMIKLMHKKKYETS